MKAGGRIILSILCSGLILVSCQSSVRFSSSKSHINTRTHEPSDRDVPKENSWIVDYSGLGELRARIMKKAESLIGSPYCYGGYSASCFDCSGFVKACYADAGIELPRISGDMFTIGEKVDVADVLPGDLFFFSEKGSVNHVGIASGKYEMIHSSTSHGVVRQSLYDKYFSAHLAGARKIIR